MRATPDRMATVYIVRANRDDVYKIGFTSTLFRRLSLLDRELPHGVELVESIKTLEPARLERMLHTEFSAKRVRGEWFQLSKEDLKVIKGVKMLEYAVMDGAGISY